MRFRGGRWLALAALLLAVYAALGFWLLPFVIQRELPRFAGTELGRRASVSAVRFNPFTLRFEASGLVLAEANAQALFAAKDLAVQLQWRSIVRRAGTLAEVRLTEPKANLAIAPDGRFNVAELIATITKRWPSDP